MAILNNSNAISSGGYDINNSLRFRASASAYLTRTPASAGNQQKWTYSLWLKRGTLSTVQNLLVVGTNITSQQSTQFGLNNDNTIQFFDGLAGVSTSIIFDTTQVFRDPSAWYHIVLAVDTTQATSTNRVKIYVNGNQITAFTSSTYPTQNFNTLVNAASAHYIGRFSNVSTNYFDGYLAETYIIDGQQLTPSSFGETDTTTGSWKPKAYTGTYGTNGFYLKFSDIATTSGSNAGLGKDFSGNTNYWTTNNISVTAGTTYDAMIDSPTLTSATVANYSVVSPIDVTSVGATISNGNLRFNNGNAGAQSAARATIGVSSGKWYWETTCTTFGGSNPDTGILGTNSSLASSDQYVGNYALGYSYGGNGQKRNNNSGSAYGSSYTSGDVIGVALDMDAGTLTFYKNNTSQGTAFSSLSGTFSPAISGYNGVVWDVNFGQRPFSYTPPTGFVRLNTYNLPDSTIKKGDTVMDATLYTGNGTTSNIVNAGGFKPDLVWMKNRGSAQDHALLDSIRGTTGFLISNYDGGTSTAGDLSISYNSNGFSAIGANARSNASTNTYVGWQWQAGQGSTSSNTSGSITTTTSVNATAGFSMFTFTGTGASASIGHGLGVAPKFMLFKRRDAANNWNVLTNATGSNQYGFLNLTTAFASAGETWTSTIINIGGNFANGGTYVCYAWAEIAGFSRFGSYVGNGSTDGPFIYLGFRPKYILIKNTTNYDWHVFDAARNSYNFTNSSLKPNTTGTEYTNNDVSVDLLSNGFKLRGTDLAINGSGNTHIVAAWAENPFKNALAR